MEEQMVLASQTSRRRGYILALEAEYGEEFGMEDPGDLSSWLCSCLMCEFTGWDSTSPQPNKNV